MRALRSRQPRKERIGRNDTRFFQGVLSELCSIVDGEVDNLPESAFYNVGTIDEAREKAEKLKGATK